MKTSKLFLTILSALSFSSSAQLCFNPVIRFPAGAPDPRSILSVDFNKDGNLDLVTGNYAANNISIFLGNGTGNFGAHTTYTTGNIPNEAVSVDFNGDTFADIAVITTQSNGVSVLLGVGDGSFNSATSYPVGGNNCLDGICSADFNNDSKADLAIACGGNSKFMILLGNGLGGFSSLLTYTLAVNSSPQSILSADFNKDGKADLALANYNDSLTVFLGLGTGNFSAPSNFPIGSHPLFMTAGDFNGDSNTDIAVTTYYSNSVSLFLGTGTGSFGPVTSFPATRAASITNADFDNDGKLDLAIGNDVSEVLVLLGTGVGSFGLPTTLTITNTGSYIIFVSNGDVNNDGKADLITANANDSSISVLLNCSPFSIDQHITGDLFLKVYPNPSSDVLHITISNKYVKEIIITDVLGNETFRTSNLALPTSQVDVSNLQNGIYFVRAKSAEGTTTSQKLIIQH